jgi:hypothetical protein
MQRSGKEEVFETPDVDDPVEASGVRVPPIPPSAESANENIDAETIAPSRAFSIFQQRELFGRDAVDLVPGRPAIIKSHAPATGGTAVTEPPLMRFRRLKLEAAELAQELEALRDAADGSKPLAAVDPAALSAAQMGSEVLMEQLKALERDERLAPVLDPSRGLEVAQTMQDSLSKQLLDHVQALAGGVAGASSAGASSAGGTGSGGTGSGGTGTDATPSEGGGRGDGPGRVVYELYGGGGAAEERRALAAGALEQRLKRLERAVGGRDDLVPDADSAIASAAVPLAARVRELERRAAVMDQQGIERVARRMKALTVEFDAFARKMSKVRAAGAAANPLREQRLQRMHKLLNECENLAPMLPSLVARLHTLKIVHEEASLFTHRLAAAEAAQERAATLLEGDKNALATAEASLRENMETIQANLRSLDERISRLSA